MSTYPDIKLDDYYFIDQSSLIDRILWTRNMFGPIAPIGVYLPAINTREKKLWKIASFKDVAKVIGLYDQETGSFLELQSKKLHVFTFLLIILAYLIQPILFVTLFFWYLRLLTASLLFIKPSVDILNNIFVGALLFMLILFFLTMRITFSVCTLLLERKFAESLCVMQIVYILLELTPSDALRTRKADLLDRMNFLANRLTLMGMNYPGSDELNKQWVYAHFHKISRFVREHERLVIAPTENSLEQLRQDFLRLGRIFLKGDYGSFDFQVSTIEKEEQKPKSLWTQILTLIVGMASLAIPVLVLGFMITSPEVFNQLNINRDAVFYISIAWLLLALDKLLGMGIIERFLSLVKAAKELR